MSYYEPVDPNGDPLELLLRAEGADNEADELIECYMSASHRTRTMEVERTSGDTMGMSPAELAAQDWLH